MKLLDDVKTRFRYFCQLCNNLDLFTTAQLPVAFRTAITLFLLPRKFPKKSSSFLYPSSARSLPASSTFNAKRKKRIIFKHANITSVSRGIWIARREGVSEGKARRDYRFCFILKAYLVLTEAQQEDEKGKMDSQVFIRGNSARRKIKRRKGIQTNGNGRAENREEQRRLAKRIIGDACRRIDRTGRKRKWRVFADSRRGYRDRRKDRSVLEGEFESNRA